MPCLRRFQNELLEQGYYISLHLARDIIYVKHWRNQLEQWINQMYDEQEASLIHIFGHFSQQHILRFEWSQCTQCLELHTLYLTITSTLDRYWELYSSINNYLKNVAMRRHSA